MTLSDLIAVMRDGQLVQYGSPREIYARPNNLYVASFVGKPSMSLLPAALELAEDELFLVGKSLRLRLGRPEEVVDGRARPADVVAGFRAENLRVVHGAAADSDRAFRGVIQLIEPIGSDTFVELEAGGATVVARVHPDERLEIGQAVSVEVDAARVHLFEPSGGARLSR
jgi:multiple sugar transport system ATP-binding protein